MIGAFFPLQTNPAQKLTGCAIRKSCALRAILFAASALFAIGAAAAQVVTIDTSKQGPVAVQQGQETQVDRQYQQIVPTNVQLPAGIMDTKTRLELLRVLQAEQGFAMRPFPHGHKGLTLVANGKLDPAGEGYLNMVVNNGVSAKPGDRVSITDIQVDHGKIILQLNGGPDAKHRFLSHIELGTGQTTNPVVQDVKD